jgi:hypothetical protein
MADLMLNELKYQGRHARAMYVYNATMNDELSFVTDDIIVITQSSEDETWFEGTLNGRTGWFPSNYVEVIQNSEQLQQTDSNDSLKQYESDNPQDTVRIKVSLNICLHNLSGTLLFEYDLYYVEDHKRF